MKARQDKKIIITCAITGSAHTPTLSPYLPYKPEDIAEQAIDAVNAGASILHMHARDPLDGRPSSAPKDYLSYLPAIKESCDVVVNITTGGSVMMSIEERLQAADALQPEMCSLNMGSINFGLHPMAAKPREWKFDWERDYLLNTKGGIFKNTFDDIEEIISKIGDKYGTKFEHECYDVGHLYNLAHFVDRKKIKPPFFIQSIFGIMGGIGPDVQNLMFMKETADRLFGDDFVWSILGAGRAQFPLITHGALMGGNVRVGLEDNLWIDRGELAQSNAVLVSKAKSIVEELGYSVATPNEARQILNLKGLDNVAF